MAGDPGDTRAAAIDTERVLGREQQHYGVIDIGSNSIRLVVYDDLSRAPFPRFNEKSMSALGAGLDASGNLTDDAIGRALYAIRRFAGIAKAMDVTRLDAIATEATRRAGNGRVLVDRIREATGVETRVLTGEEEAHYTTLGIVAGFHAPHGIVGDIGGGSLEFARVLGDRVGTDKASMPLGALPVGTLMEKKGIDAAKAEVDAVLDAHVASLAGPDRLFAVGGGWRAIARIHVAMNEVPVNVVHGYEMEGNDARRFARRVARMSPDEVAALPDVPGRRVRTLPASALVLWRVAKRLSPGSVVFSAYGVREGWLYSQLGGDEQRRDPLIESAQAIGLPVARVPEFARALARWTEGVFADESATERRLRLAACALTDLGWRDHTKVRAVETFQRLLQFPFAGIDHAERAFLAVAILARYNGRVDAGIRAKLGGLLDDAAVQRAEVLGRTLLLAHRFSASVPEILEHARLRIEPACITLELLNPEALPDSDAVQTRLRQLARAARVADTQITLARGTSMVADSTYLDL